MADAPMNPLKLSDEDRQRLLALSPGVEKARKALETMKSLGLDTTDLEDKLKWATEVRETLLSKFE